MYLHFEIWGLGYFKLMNSKAKTSELKSSFYYPQSQRRLNRLLIIYTSYGLFYGIVTGHSKLQENIMTATRCSLFRILGHTLAFWSTRSTPRLPTPPTRPKSLQGACSHLLVSLTSWPLEQQQRWHRGLARSWGRWDPFWSLLNWGSRKVPQLKCKPWHQWHEMPWLE